MSDAVIYVLAAWVGIVSGLLTASVVISVFLRWGLKWWRSWLEDEVMASLHQISDQMQSNGGNRKSIGTTLERIERNTGPDRPTRRRPLEGGS